MLDLKAWIIRNFFPDTQRSLDELHRISRNIQFLADSSAYAYPTVKSVLSWIAAGSLSYRGIQAYLEMTKGASDDPAELSARMNHTHETDLITRICEDEDWRDVEAQTEALRAAFRLRQDYERLRKLLHD